MKSILKQIPVMIAMCIIGYSAPLHAQSVYKVAPRDNNMKLSGTSTLHNWTMNAQAFGGEAQFVFKPGNDRQLNSIKALTFSLAVADLKSGENGLDKNAYKALKTDVYKSIVYKLTSAVISPEKGNRYLIKTHGSLTIAGVTKEISMDVFAVVNADETISCTGTQKLLMTEYGVKPPKFMFGAMKTGDAVTIDFNLIYKK